MSRRVVLASAVVLAGLQSSGCLLLPGFDRHEGEPWQPPETPSEPVVHNPPTFTAVSIPDWPPLGSFSALSVSVSDPDANLRLVEFQFSRQDQRMVSGGFAIVSMTGAALGEGFGTLTMQATDTTGAFARKTVNDLLVDLTPPKITLTETIVPADGVLEVWVGDAWILGKVRLSFAGQSLLHEFEPGFPETLGKTWDYSLVKFDMSELPAEMGPASIRATDAAGNAIEQSFSLLIDGQPPEVSITAPEADAVLSGTVAIELAASDPEGPVQIELAIDGTPVASANGPTATIQLHTSEFLPGPTTLTATAVDAAGNVESTSRSVVIE